MWIILEHSRTLGNSGLYKSHGYPGITPKTSVAYAYSIRRWFNFLTQYCMLVYVTCNILTKKNRHLLRTPMLHESIGMEWKWMPDVEHLQYFFIFSEWVSTRACFTFQLNFLAIGFKWSSSRFNCI